MKTIKTILEYIALTLFVLVLASGPIALIICIITKNMLFLDVFCVYAVVVVSFYFLNRLVLWSNSLGKKE